MVLSDVRRTGVIILAIAVWLSGRQHCIKRSGVIRLATSMSRARPSGLAPPRGRPITTILLSLVLLLLG